MRKLGVLFACAPWVLVAACSSASNGGAAALLEAGADAAGVGVSTSSAGGTGSATGGAASGGNSPGGGTGNGGASAADAASAGGAPAEEAGGPSPPRPSAGCGATSPPTGPLTMSVQGNTADYIVTLPASYDPSTPLPVAFGFHGRGRTGADCMNGDCSGFASVMQEQAVLVYMKSLGGDGWEGSTERELNVAFFQAVLAELRTGYCIDEARIFVAGTSSGAHFVNVLGCRFGDILRGVVPVAGVLPEKDGCVGNPAALVIHGVDDSHVPFTAGEEARDFYRDRNGCTATTVPLIADLHARVVATRESHECAEHQGCAAGEPVVWCEHSEGGYDGSTHGWPKFGGQAVWDFIERFGS